MKSGAQQQAASPLQGHEAAVDTWGAFGFLASPREEGAAR